MLTFDSDVLIAGAGPVGLALALDLGRQGFSIVVLDGETEATPEHRDRKANAINNRSMEYMRRLGVADAIRARVEAANLTLDVTFVTSLVGHELARFVNAFESSPDLPPAGMSPESYLRVNQIDILEILRATLAELPNVRVLERTRLDKYEETADRVKGFGTAIDSGEPVEVAACYLLGCDGGSSEVRRRSGIKLQGQGRLASNMNVVFRSPEAYQSNVHADASMHWVVNPAFNGYIAAGPEMGRMTIWDVDDDKDADIRNNPLKYIAAAVGKPVDAEFLGFQRWHTHHLVAQEYRKGHVFIAGDAAHMHPPTCGLGMNTGLGDASNLGWKLAAVLHGWGGEKLLESYQIERQPIGARVVALSNHQYSLAPRAYWDETLDDETPEADQARRAMGERVIAEKATEFYSRGMVLGQTYKPSPVVVDDGVATLNTDEISYTPTAQAGARVPHIERDGRSIYDSFEPFGFTLLCIGGHANDARTMEATAAAAGVPLSVLHLEPSHRALYEAVFVLVRPDHHVAWRGDEPFSARDLDTARGAGR